MFVSIISELCYYCCTWCVSVCVCNIVVVAVVERCFNVCVENNIVQFRLWGVFECVGK